MQSQTLDLDLDLPGSEDLPFSDDTPVDNENQIAVPHWLLEILEEIWDERHDWFFALNMGIYDPEHQRKRTPIVIPDGFLSIGVKRYKPNKPNKPNKTKNFGRLSYVLREENNIPPILALEMVSQTYGDEYGSKFERYSRLGVKYYIIYNPQYNRRDRHEPFEVYKLVEGIYELQEGEPYWIEEVGLGIGRVVGKVGEIDRERLGWYDRQGNPYPLPPQSLKRKDEELAQERQQNQRKDQQLQQKDEQLQQKDEQLQQKDEQLQQKDEQLAQERQQNQQMREKLRSLGIDPDL